MLDMLDAGYNKIVFAATQSDNILRSEIAGNLGLPQDTPLLDCAVARNRFTKERIQKDFIDGWVVSGKGIGETWA